MTVGAPESRIGRLEKDETGEAMNQSEAKAHFRQLCCLGLPEQTVVAALLKALHHIVPSYANSFMWSDARGRVCNTLVENLSEVEPILPVYFNHYEQLREREVRIDCAELLQSRQGVLFHEETLRVSRREYLRHPFYNEVMRPSGNDQPLSFILRREGRPLGLGMLGRRVGETSFSRADKGALQSLLPHFTHALSAPAQPTALADSGREGFAIVDRLGGLLHLSANAEHWIYLARHPVISRRGRPRGTIDFDTVVARLLQRLRCADSDAPPAWEDTNAWGGFVFRAYWLDAAEPGAQNDGSGPAALISIRYREPVALKLLRRLQDFPLSPRQREVALWLAQGVTLRTIGRRLHISERTAAAHTRGIYDKLDIHNRAELASRLLT